MKKARWEKDDDDIMCVTWFLIGAFLLWMFLIALSENSAPVLIDAPMPSESIEGYRT